MNMFEKKGRGRPKKDIPFDADAVKEFIERHFTIEREIKVLREDTNISASDQTKTYDAYAHIFYFFALHVFIIGSKIIFALNFSSLFLAVFK